MNLIIFFLEKIHDTSAVSEFGTNNIVQVSLLKNVREKVALSIERALIQCVGEENCCNVVTPRNDLVEFRPEIMHRIAFYILHNCIYEHYKPLQEKMVAQGQEARLVCPVLL